MFWSGYDDKATSSKSKTLIKWNKMSKNKQQNAYNYIPRFFMSILNGTRKKHAKTYWESELWNN